MNNRLLTLTDGDFLELPDARGTTLHVQRGSLWVTQECDPVDVMLHAGDTWTVERQGLTVGEARGDTGVRVIGNGYAEAQVTSRHAPWPQRASHWLSTVLERHLTREWLPHL